MTLRPIPSPLPALNTDAQAHHDAMLTHIRQTIQQQGGWVSFDEFMQMALYTPRLGYYSGEANKFGKQGDFVTAPEISPLFGVTLTNQIAQVLAETGGVVLELGAGTGKLAMDILQRLHALDCLPAQYYILEVSASLRHRQQAALREALPAALFNQVVWLEALPEGMTGVVVGNEVLDAIPVHLLTRQNGVWLERGVGFQDGLIWKDNALRDETLPPEVNANLLPDGYVTEVCPAAKGLIASLASMLQQGLILLLDYGFGAREYYHPQRNQGTLMCHFQHYAHADPFIHLGLQDITAHVNFTAIADAGLANGLDCLGYTNQAQFLINCGILQQLQTTPAEDARYPAMASAVQKLLSPAEMGELFKVVALGKGLSFPLMGFAAGDKRHTL
jgi:SAM-dependent MidA family methyltransferase